MKILSRMLSKKIEPEEAAAATELPPEEGAPRVARPSRPSRPLADDTGRVNSSRTPSRRPVNAKLSAPVTPKNEEPEVAGSGWAESDWDDENWDDDEDWGEEDFDEETRRRTADKKQLVSEIRDAMDAAKRVRSEPPVVHPGAAAQETWPEFATTPEAIALMNSHIEYLTQLGIVKE